MNLSQRSYTRELLDGDNIPFDDIRQNMYELNKVNTLLGGHAVSIAGLKRLLGSQKTVTICEIGCGGADNMIALNKWCTNNHINASFIGVDIKPECIGYAKQQMKTDATWLVSDYRQVVFEQKPEIIFSSLFCHHFSDEELVEQISWMHLNSTAGFFINDLHRHSLAYWSIKFLTSCFSSSYLVKNDAPLSVARAFKRSDWRRVFKAAGLTTYQISWKWAFRYLITYNNAAK